MLVPKTFSEIFGALKEQLCSTRHILSFSMSVLISSFLGISYSVSLSLSTSMSDHHLFFFFFFAKNGRVSNVLPSWGGICSCLF